MPLMSKPSYIILVSLLESQMPPGALSGQTEAGSGMVQWGETEVTMVTPISPVFTLMLTPAGLLWNYGRPFWIQCKFLFG